MIQQLKTFVMQAWTHELDPLILPAARRDPVHENCPLTTSDFTYVHLSLDTQNINKLN